MTKHMMTLLTANLKPSLFKRNIMISRTIIAVLLASMIPVPAMADEKSELLKLKEKIANEREELLELKNTTTNLIELFVEQGLLDKEKAKVLVNAAKKKAAQEAKDQIAKERAEEKQVAEPKVVKSTAPDKPAGEKEKVKEKGPVFVGYVPEFVKDEIRQQVRADLKDEVVQEVKANAKKEAWGIPAALPEWLNRTRLTFDMRLRGSNDFFGNDNAPFLDYLSINRDGGHIPAFQRNEEFQNTEFDRLRFSQRFRAGFEMDITDSLKAGVRLATSNMRNPVSNDQSLGVTGQSYELAIDRGFLQYDYRDAKGKDRFSVYGGRFRNPFFSTDVVYDSDLSFEGFAATFRERFNEDAPNVKNYKPPALVDLGGRFGINMGPQTPNTMFATVGVFPIQEVNLSEKDKWLFGGQAGVDWLVHDQSRFKAAVSFYHFHNTRARANAPNSFANDWTAPQFVQWGNTMVPINVNEGNELDGTPINSRCNSTQSFVGQGCLYGLASDFNIFNFTALYDYAGFAPINVMFTFDFTKNFGYNANRIQREFAGRLLDNRDKTTAYQFRMDVGDRDALKFKNWNAFIAYRYIERDAVLDAFTDSVFHLGGTNAQGWWIGGNYGIANNTWVNLRWMSASAIHGPTLNVDSLLLDLNVRF